MDFLKDLFENGAIDWDTFSKAVGEKGYKLADLSKGEYVSKNKYSDDLTTKITEINNLTTQLNTRDTDLKDLQTQLANSKNDADVVKELNKRLEKLQHTYEETKTKYENQIAAQQYEFAVKEFANTQKFSSNAAKRDFVHNMVEKHLNFEDGKLIGANDYLEEYKQQNADSFVVDTPDTKPQFIDTTKQKQSTDKVNPFLEAMNFTGVRPHNKENKD